jgi:hypothetical protein
MVEESFIVVIRLLKKGEGWKYCTKEEEMVKEKKNKDRRCGETLNEAKHQIEISHDV